MVEGVAMAKKHQRTQGRRTSGGTQLQQGGIIDIETFIDISNVQVVCSRVRQGDARSATGPSPTAARSGSAASATRS